MVAQHDENDKKEKAVYYLSRSLTAYEERYTPMEKTCLATVFAAKNLAHYLKAHSVKLITHMDPIKYLFEKPTLSDRMARWQSYLSQYDISYVSQKSVKGQSIADHLENHPLSDDEPVQAEFPDEMLFVVEKIEE